MKVSSVFIVAAAIITGQASAQLAIAGRRAITGRRPGTKQRNALKGEVRRLQKNDESSLSMAESFVVEGTQSKGQKDKTSKGKSPKSTAPSMSKSSGKGKCSIKKMRGSTYIPQVDIVAPNHYYSNYGFQIMNQQVTVSFDPFETFYYDEGGEGGVSYGPPNGMGNGMGSMAVNFCIGDHPWTLIAVQTGLGTHGSFTFTMTPVWWDQHQVSDENEQKLGERRTKEEKKLDEILGANKQGIFLPWTLNAEYDCNSGRISFGGNTLALGIGFATKNPTKRFKTENLQTRGKLDGSGCFDNSGTTYTDWDTEWS